MNSRRFLIFRFGCFLVLMLGFAYAETGRVIKVIDGDTFVFEDEQRVRILGVDAPETRGEDEPFSQEATAFIKVLLLNQTVTMEPDGISPDKDRYGRLLRYVYVDGQDVSRKLIEAGLGTVLREYRIDKMEEYLQAEAEAKRKKIGLWADRKSVV